MSEAGWYHAHSVKDAPGILVLLYIQPGASRTAWKGVHPTTPPRAKLSVQAPPLDGAANAAVTEFVAKRFGVPKSRVHILTGEQSRQKNVWIEGLTLEEAEQVLTQRDSK